MNGPVICVVGPTATGKSDLGVWLAKIVGGEVISADSMQVYRGMDIGTAKLTEAEMQGVPHHLIDIINPDDPFTVAKWTKEADAVISHLHAHGKVPIVVGGTGLYIRAITEDLDFSEEGSSEIRKKWEQFAAVNGTDALHHALRDRDSASADRLHPNDVRRIVRALEVYETTGRPLSAGYDWRDKGGRYRTLQIGLEMERQVLYDRVEARVELMLGRGLMAEVKGLLEHGYTPDLQSMQAIGYKEPIRYLAGDLTYGEAVEELKRNTRRFVKRQFSWFKRDERIHWLPATDSSSLIARFGEDLRRQVMQHLAGI